MSKKLNIIEAMKMPIGTEFEVIFNGEKMPNNTMKIYRSLEGKNDCKHMDWTCHPKEISMKPYDFLINGVFIPIQQPVSFMEAIKGKTIRLEHELVVNGSIKGNLEFIIVYLGQTQESEKLKKIFLEGKWYIEESEDDSNDIG